MIVFQLFEIVATFIEALLGILIIMRMLGNDDAKLKESVIASFVITFLVWIINQYQLFSVVATGMGLLGTIAAVCIIHKAKISDVAVLTAAYILMIYILDFLSITMLGIVFKDAQFAARVTGALSWVRISLLVVSKALLILVYFIFAKRFLSKIHVSVRKIWIGVILCTAIVYYFVKNTFLQVDHDVFLLWFLLLLLVLTGIYSGIQCASYIQEKTRMIMATERNLLMAECYEKTIQNYEMRQLANHNLKNQYLVIEEYLKRKEYVKAEEYVEKLEAASYEDINIRTGINALDIFMECKLKEAEVQGISMEIIADIVQFNVTDQEMIALIGNALDVAGIIGLS